MPDASRLPTGCPFHPRCVFRLDICSEQDPALREVERQGEAPDEVDKRPRTSACHYVERNPEAKLLPLLAEKRAREELP